MQQAAEGIEAAGGLIGHIKAFAEERNRTLAVSVTDTDSLVKHEADIPALTADITHIVFQVGSPRLVKILRQIYEPYFIPAGE